jgi:hypothetical protein
MPRKISANASQVEMFLSGGLALQNRRRKPLVFTIFPVPISFARTGAWT